MYVQSTLQSSGVSLKLKPRVSNIYPHSKFCGVLQVAVFKLHRQSFKNSNLKNATELSKHIWHLKGNNEEYDLSWRIIDKAKPYNGSSNKCSLCLLEKYHILMRSDLLNSRSELVSKCRHRRSHLIGSVK